MCVNLQNNYKREKKTRMVTLYMCACKLGNIADGKQNKKRYTKVVRNDFFWVILQGTKERQGIYSAVIEGDPALLSLLLVLLL